MTAYPRSGNLLGYTVANSSFQLGNYNRCELCLSLLEEREGPERSTLISISSVSRCDIYKGFDPSRNSHKLWFKAGSVSRSYDSHSSSFPIKCIALGWWNQSFSADTRLRDPACIYLSYSIFDNKLLSRKSDITVTCVPVSLQLDIVHYPCCAIKKWKPIKAVRALPFPFYSKSGLASLWLTE